MKKNLLYLNYVLSRKLTSATRNILRLVPATSIIVFSVGYDSNHMMLNGKFSYKKENQRTLSFNVDIVKLPEHKTVFTGSSSNWESFIWSAPLISSCVQATTVCTDLRFVWADLWDHSFSPSTCPQPCSSWWAGSPSSFLRWDLLSASSCCGVQNAFKAFCLTTFTMRLCLMAAQNLLVSYFMHS